MTIVEMELTKVFLNTPKYSKLRAESKIRLVREFIWEYVSKKFICIQCLAPMWGELSIFISKLEI